MYLSTKDSMNSDYFFKPNLLGGSISFSTDISEINCGCKTLFYGVPMLDSDVAKDFDDPFGHCDASGEGPLCS